MNKQTDKYVYTYIYIYNHIYPRFGRFQRVWPHATALVAAAAVTPEPCSGFLPKTKPMQHSCSHSNAFRSIPSQTCTYLRAWQHQMTKRRGDEGKRCLCRSHWNGCMIVVTMWRDAGLLPDATKRIVMAACMLHGLCFVEEAGARNLVFFRVKWLQPAMKGTTCVRRVRLRSFGSFYVFCNNGCSCV